MEKHWNWYNSTQSLPKLNMCPIWNFHIWAWYEYHLPIVGPECIQQQVCVFCWCFPAPVVPTNTKTTKKNFAHSRCLSCIVWIGVFTVFSNLHLFQPKKPNHSQHNSRQAIHICLPECQMVAKTTFGHEKIFLKKYLLWVIFPAHVYLNTSFWNLAKKWPMNQEKKGPMSTKSVPLKKKHTPETFSNQLEKN